MHCGRNVNSRIRLPRMIPKPLGKLVEGLAALNQLACVQQTSMAGDRLHIITAPGECSVDLLMRTLTAQGISDAQATPAEATLEDVFVSLARG